MTLVRKFKELIAARRGTQPEQVTGESIRRRRESCRFPEDHTNDYGGRVPDGLDHLTDEEIKSALKSYEEMTHEVETK